jgi:hypothetical protein
MSLNTQHPHNALSNSLITSADTYLKKEGLIHANEQFETIYLAEDEIEKFMEKYMLENPDTEIETRYIDQPPIEVVQDIEVRWLRPETPEIPPIIIKEVVDTTPYTNAETQPTIRIVQTSRREPNPNESKNPPEPLIIRERPPVLPIPEPKFAYVQNVIKRQVAPPPHQHHHHHHYPTSNQQQTKVQHIPEGKEIKVEHVRSESQTSFSNKGSMISDVKSLPTTHQPNNFSFEEHHSIIEDEEEHEYGMSRMNNKSLNSLDDIYRLRNENDRSQNLEDEHQLRLYEEKLKQTLYEEYLLRLEREKLEKKLTESGLFEQRIRERSTSHDRGSSLLSNARYSENVLNNQEYVSKLDREHELKERQLRFHQQQQRQKNENRTSRSQDLKSEENAAATESGQLNESFGSGSETSTYKNIKFSKVLDQKDLKRYNEILTNPNSPSIKTKTEGDKIMTTFDETKKADGDKKTQQLNNKPTNEPIHRRIQPRSYQNSDSAAYYNVSNLTIL